MKKLMIGAAIALAAVATQAATFNWATSEIAYAIDKNTVGDGLAAATTYGADTTKLSVAGGTGSSAYGTFTYFLTLSDGVNSDTLSGKLTSGDFSSGYLSLDLEHDLAVPGETLSYTWKIVGDITDGAGNAWTITSDVITDTWKVQTQGDVGVTLAAPSTWTTNGASPEPTPEPTSGLLLLLGVAGLALKRKRA